MSLHTSLQSFGLSVVGSSTGEVASSWYKLLIFGGNWLTLAADEAAANKSKSCFILRILVLILVLRILVALMSRRPNCSTACGTATSQPSKITSCHLFADIQKFNVVTKYLNKSYRERTHTWKWPQLDYRGNVIVNAVKFWDLRPFRHLIRVNESPVIFQQYQNSTSKIMMRDFFRIKLEKKLADDFS